MAKGILPQITRGKRERPLAISRIDGFPGISNSEVDNEGNLEERQALEDGLPDLLDADPPEHMSPVARMLWTDLLPAFLEARLLKTIDVAAFEAMCEAYADCVTYRKAIAELRSPWLKMTDEDGEVISLRAHPALAALQDADRRFRSWLVEFGMTPSSRAAMWGPRRHGRQPLPRVGDEELGLEDLSDDERRALREMLDRRRTTTEALAHEQRR
jgi:P27 family predicted phage terminase small subunit